MTTIWYREEEDEKWMPVEPWKNINEERAHEIADTYNTKHDYGMWWVSNERPSKDCVVE